MTWSEIAWCWENGPSCWPKKARRLFLLTLPLSGPLYLASWVVVMAVAFVVYTIGSPIAWAVDIWND
jgi:hypothetical protein